LPEDKYKQVLISQIEKMRSGKNSNKRVQLFNRVKAFVVKSKFSYPDLDKTEIRNKPGRSPIAVKLRLEYSNFHSPNLQVWGYRDR